MGNIWKAARLDLALVRPYWKSVCFNLVLPVVFAAVNRSLLTGICFAMSTMAMATVYPFSIAEKNGMERLYGILPVPKGALVLGRYVFVLAMGLLSLGVSLLAQPPVLRLLGVPVEPSEIVTAAAVGALLFVLFMVFQVPGYYRFGSIKGRAFLYIPVGGFLVISLALSKVPAVGRWVDSAAEAAPGRLIFSGALILLTLCALSVLLSVRIMENKEL
ncbi:MAG: ABC-2 transporter permease [Eubacteriales bacterium]|nr:ABC-2 transporter permease [Eubacteriales bacterium]